MPYSWFFYKIILLKICLYQQYQVQQRLSQMNIDKITLLTQYSNWKEKIRKKEEKKIPGHLPRHITHILDSRNKYYNESLHIRNYVLKSLCALCCSCKCRRASTDAVEV